MSAVSIVVLCFSVLGAIDYLLGNKMGLAQEFQKAFSIFMPMALSMLGMIVIAPAIGVWLTPAFDGFYNLFGIDPSVLPASVFANDMGGASLAQSICKTTEMGNYNAFVVASMMGCVISFTIPFSIGIVKQEQHKELFLGILCGMVTIPLGCFVAGLILKLKVGALLLNLLPLIIFAVVIGAALLLFPKACIKCFTVFGYAMKILGVVGLMCAIFTFLTKIEINPNFDTLESAAFVCVNACVTLSGALPLMMIVSKLLKKPLNKLGALLGINAISTLALLGTIVTNASTFGVMDQMDKKGVLLNAAFAVSASFALGSHLAYTMAFDGAYALPMIVGKLISGVCALLLAALIGREKAAAAEPIA